MRVQINPANKPNGQDLVVLHPDTKGPFPSGPFDLSADDLKNPRVRRLLPPSVPGGRFGDLVLVVEPNPAADATAKKK
ncbi:MAG: hypothetical protein HQL35_14350 [Alphaproteobacteria bacterium]|nr:hypothetical protein [Alphaproteobacteria bacterium]